MGATYTYLAVDLLSNQILAELPLSGSNFDSLLNGAGAFQAKLPLADRRIQKLDPIGSTQPGRTALYVDRDGSLVWGGIIWTRRYSGADDTLTLAGAEFWSYYKRVFAAGGVSTGGVSQDQLSIVQSLLTGLQAFPAANLGLQIGTETSGVLRTLTHYSYELKPYGDMVEEMSQSDTGFDFAIDVAYNAGVPTKYLHLGYPRRGRPAAGTGLVFSFPGNVTGFDWDEDAASQATRLFVQGAGEGDAMQRTTQVAQDLLDAGYPLLDSTISFKDNTITPVTADSYAVLASRARAESAALKATVTLPSFTVRADLDPVFGSYITGDSVTVEVGSESSRFPNGITTTQRINQISLQPGDDASAEQVTLTLGVDLV